MLPGIASGDLYARWYLLLPSTNAVGVDLAGIHIIEQGAPNGAVSFEIENDQVGLELTTTPTVTRAISTTTFPRDRWVCVQLHLAIADAGGAATLAIDGTTVVERTGIDTRPATGFSNLHAGIFATSAANIMREVYTDEFAVARSPIPCD